MAPAGHLGSASHEARAAADGRGSLGGILPVPQPTQWVCVCVCVCVFVCVRVFSGTFVSREGTRRFTIFAGSSKMTNAPVGLCQSCLGDTRNGGLHCDFPSRPWTRMNPLHGFPCGHV